MRVKRSRKLASEGLGLHVVVVVIMDNVDDLNSEVIVGDDISSSEIGDGEFDVEFRMKL